MPGVYALSPSPHLTIGVELNVGVSLTSVLFTTAYLDVFVVEFFSFPQYLTAETLYLIPPSMPVIELLASSVYSVYSVLFG